MPNINLTDLSDKQRQVWLMRFRYGWRMKRIALELGIRPHAVSQLLQRAQRRAGLGRPRRVRVIRAQPRLAAVQSLSTVFDI
jgi:DNA-directed RNA polymerase specialized sigma24 family protein